MATNEREEDFTFFFQAIQDAVKESFGIDFIPRVLVCDAAKSIQNAFQNVFEVGDNIIMCWAHVRRNIVKNLSKYIRDRKKQSEFLGELNNNRVLELKYQQMFLLYVTR